MLRRPSRLVTVTAAVVVALPLVAGGDAKVYGTPPQTEAPLRAFIVPQGNMAPLAKTPPDEPPTSFVGIDKRIKQATAAAAAKGADVTTVVLDRSTGRLLSNGNRRGIAIASVVKLFIADDLLIRGERLSPDERKSFESMLRSSDDSAAEIFWNRGGGSAIVTRVADRYGLAGTHPPFNGRWFNTVSTTTDLVRYYDMLLSGAGGLPRDKADIIINNLAASTPVGIDGTQPGGLYPQRFGIPDGLYSERVAVKQGWMCCIGADWMHLSTGIVGADRRYVIAIASHQPADPAEARNTITEAVKTMFPGGRI